MTNTNDCPPVGANDLYDLMPWGVCTIDRDLVVSSWNTTLADWTGIRPQRAIGATLGELFPSLTDPVIRNGLMEVFESGKLAVFSGTTTKHLLPIPTTNSNDGELMIQQMHVRPIGTSRERVLLIIEDVTLQSRQIEELFEEKNHLNEVLHELKVQSEQLGIAHAIIEFSQDAIVCTSLDGVIRMLNAGDQQLYDITAEEAIGQPLSAFVEKERASLLARCYEQVNDGQCVEPFDVLVRRKGGDGGLVDVSVTVSPVWDADNRTSNISVIARDISERKMAEKNAAYLSVIVESSEDAIIGKTVGGVITSWNEGAEQLYGYRSDEAVGRRDDFLVPPGQMNTVIPLLEKAGRGECTDHFDMVRLHKSNTVIEVSMNVSPIRDNQGKIIGVSTITRNVTERKQIEGALRRSMEELIESHEELNEMRIELELNNQKLANANRLAEQASKTKGEFLANISHEIRTPMTAILGFSEILLNDESLDQVPPSHVEALKTIRRNGEYLLELINDILDLSKIEAGKLNIECIRCSPTNILRDVQSLMQIRSDAKNLPLEIEFDGLTPAVIHSDPTRLRQILINLVGNAIKFTEVGKVRVVTRLVGENGTEPLLQFDVIDTGIGMTEEQQSRLFRPFTQADTSTTRKFGGTGLGLTISKRLTDLLGGTISISSVRGEGTTFTLTVATGPLDGVDMLQSFNEADSSAKTTVKKRDGIKLNCRILLAEDGPDNQRLIAFALKKAGAEVEVADNGQIAADMALEQLRAGQPFDVILTDIQMPVLDGYGATAKLREEGYTGPIIALTANAMEGARENAWPPGATITLPSQLNGTNSWA